jgi:recombination DNA repair RAD52 pathway protein
LAAKVNSLEQAQQTRAAFFEHNPDITGRVAEIDRSIERETEAERRRSWELLVAREQARSITRGHHIEHDLGPGLDL